MSSKVHELTKEEIKKVYHPGPGAIPLSKIRLWRIGKGRTTYLFKPKIGKFGRPVNRRTKSKRRTRSRTRTRTRSRSKRKRKSKRRSKRRSNKR